MPPAHPDWQSNDRSPPNTPLPLRSPSLRLGRQGSANVDVAEAPLAQAGDCLQERTDVTNRSQVVYLFRGRGLGDKLTVLGGEAAVAKRDHAIAAKRAAPQWTIFWPAFRV